MLCKMVVILTPGFMLGTVILGVTFCTFLTGKVESGGYTAGNPVLPMANIHRCGTSTLRIIPRWE